MADLQQAMQALRNAHNAGDVQAATRLAGIVRKLQSEPQQTTTDRSSRLGELLASQAQYDTSARDSTIGEEFKRGFRQVGSGTRTGIASLLNPEEAATQGLERSQAISEDYGVAPSLAGFRQTYEDEGLMAAAGELAGQVPRALAGQAGNVATVIAGSKAGAMLAPPFPVAKLIGGGLGATAALLPMLLGSNVERQATTQLERGEDVDIDMSNALLAAAGQSAAEGVGTGLLLGKRLVKGLLGITDDAALATTQAQQALVRTAEQTRLGAAGRGVVRGAATEMPVEVAQSIMERAQAGLDVLSDDALAEYGEAAYLGGIVGGGIRGTTAAFEPGAARRQIARQEAEQAAAQTPPVAPTTTEEVEPSQAPAAPTETELALDEILGEGAQARAAQEAGTFYPRSDLDREANRARGRIRELEDDIIGDLTRVEPTPETPQTFEPALDVELAERSQQKARQDQEQAQRDQEARAGQDSARRQSIADIEAELAADMEKGVEPVTPAAVTPTAVTPTEVTPSAAATPTPTPPPPPPPTTTPMQFGSTPAMNAAARQIATELGLDISDADLAALVKPITSKSLPKRESAIREALQKMVPAAAAATPAATTPTREKTTYDETPTERRQRKKEEKAQGTLREQVDNTNRAIEADINRFSPLEINEAIEEIAVADGTFTDRPSKGKEKEWLRGLKETNPNRTVEIINTVRRSEARGQDPIELPGSFEEKTSFSISGAGSYSTDLFPYISDFDSALNAIVKYASNPAQREIAQKLAARIPQLEQLGFKFSLKVTQDGYQITGGASGVSRIRHYQLGANTSIEITLNHPSNGVNSGTGWVTVAHEIAHAATQAQLTYAPQGTAAVQLRALFNDVVSHFNERVKQGNLTAFEKNIYQNKNNALGNPDELLAWGLTDPEMQQWLDSIKSKNGSFLSRLFDIVASALGFSKNDTAFSELLSISDNLLTESFVPYIEAANARGKSFGRQENLTNHPTWALWAAEARPIVWSAPDAALIEAETLSGNTIYILATPQGTTQVDVSKYTGKMLPPARLKLIQKIAAGLTKTNPSMNKTAQVAEEVIFNDTPQSNSLFLKTQGAQLNSTSKPMRSKPVRDAVAKVMGTTPGSSAANAARAVLTWGLPLPALNDYVKSYIGTKGPAYEPFAAAMQRFTDTAVRYEGALREFTDSITAQIARMGEWKTNNADKYEAFTNLYFGASHAKVDLTKPESEYAGNPEKLSAYKRLKKDFIAIGGSGQAIYRQMRAIHNRQFKQISQQVFDRIYAETKNSAMATRARDAFARQMREKGPLEGYAPMLRPSGKHMLKYVIKGEDAFEIFTNPNDREARKQQLIADGVSEKDIKSFLGDNLSNFDGIVPSSFLGQLVTTLKDGGASPELIESIMNLGVSMSPPNSVLERLASRKEIAGYVRDPFWAFQEGTMGLGRKLINMQYGAKLNNELRNMKETRKNIGDDPTVASILEDVSKRANYAANPSQAWWSNVFTTGTYAWTLGFNVSSAIVDMSSLVLVTGPYLTRTYGWAKTHRAMMQSAKEIMGMGTSADVETLVTQGLEGAELQEALKTLGTKERDMVRRKTSPSMLNINFNDPAQAKKYGYLKPLVDKVRESGHSERYSELSESAELGESNLLSKWSARMGFMMNASERFKREIGIKAAYDLELSTFGANPTPEQMAAAAQKAMETSLLLNGGSTAVTGARFQQNDIARIAFMYRRFAALQMYLQAKTAYDATMNDDADVRRAARKFAGYTMLTSAALVGVKGMPMMGAVAGLWAMFGAVFGEEDEDNSLDNFLRTNLDPILVEGIPNILFNANVAGRMEMTNLLIRDSNLPNDATLADNIAAHFGGPTYGSISRAIKGAELIADGEIQRGVENMLPVSISNIFKSGRFLVEGAIETLRDDVVVEVNPFGAMAQALGFAPADYARAMDFNIGQSNAERRISDRRTGLYEAVYTAYRVGDTDGVAQAMQAIIEFNQRYPEFAITTSSLKQSISGRDRNTQDMVMGRLPSARTRGVTLETAEDWGF